MTLLNSLLLSAIAGMTQTPTIDGVRDRQFDGMPLNCFSVVEKSAETNPDLEAGYFVTHDDQGLYLYIEVEADRITGRDRGYQNGDGFHMVVGWPREGNAPTDEFHVLAFSANARGEWYEKMRWYYNKDLSFDIFGDSVEFATSWANGTAGFELFLPWDSVYPYTPLFFKRIGFNLCFVKAIGEEDFNNYYLKYDERIQWEQSPREYEVMSLEDTPAFDADALKGELKARAQVLTPGSETTLRFMVDDLDAEFRKLKVYETAEVLRRRVETLDGFFATLRDGEDPIAHKTGLYRRAYEFQGELFPYSVHLPADYSPSKQYPLLVYLHGSGQDDRALGNKSIALPDGFIVVAPNGRDVSNCFATAEAQSDIRRAIEDVEANFNIDTGRVVLSGFSMGGYGVYRTFWEDPERYSAIAILSGHPDLGTRWGGDPDIFPDFTQESNLGKFTEVPIFVYHAREDVNCPFALTAGVVEKLKKMGADVTFAVSEGGHDSMPADIRQDYFTWLWK